MRRFVFRLALALGMTVQELLGRISSQELSEWMAYYRLEPFGEERHDLQAGVIASVMANAWGEKRGKGYGPGDFVLKFEEEEKAQRSPKDVYGAFKSWASAFKKES